MNNIDIPAELVAPFAEAIDFAFMVGLGVGAVLGVIAVVFFVAIMNLQDKKNGV
jgi:hypothetical protein